MYVKLAVMRWVKLFIVGQPAGQKNVNGKGDHATICHRSILLYVYVYMHINLYPVAFDNCF